ncbi:MAG: hypothetical protein EU536_03395 [Promethearchaeota archaeon]|nr:MAG: hypothetical protein EU536_03395 [Candidatus Lokiarchaeota archaeon]
MVYLFWMNSSPNRIGFDVTQKERGRISSNYQKLKTLFLESEFDCEPITDFPILISSLQQFKAVFFACPDGSRFRADEVAAIQEYVSQGGMIIILSHAGADQGRRTNLTALTSPHGISFTNNQVMDPHSNLGVESYPLITRFNSHPLLSDIPDLCFRIGCSLNVSEGAIPLAFTQETADPPNTPVMALASHGKGSLIVTGSYEMFMDDVKGGIEYPNNAKLIKNLINWLKSPTSPVPSKKKVVHHPSAHQIKPDPPSSKIAPSHKSQNSSPQHPSLYKKELLKNADQLQKLTAQTNQMCSDQAQLKEKMKIIELNLSDFPQHAISELNVEIQDIRSHLKKNSQLISQLQQDISDLRKLFTAPKEPSVKLPKSQLNMPPETPETSLKPAVITTAASVLQQKDRTPNPRVIAELNAYQQILQILANQHQAGVLSADQYSAKREKFEKRIAELEQYH